MSAELWCKNQICDDIGKSYLITGFFKQNKNQVTKTRKHNDV